MYQATDAGYEPGISYDAGRLTSIRLGFFKDTVSLIITNPDLVLESPDGCIDEIEEEDIYNNLNSALITFNNSLSKSEQITLFQC